MRKKIAILISLIFCLSLAYQPHIIKATEALEAVITLKETKLSDSLYKLELSIEDANDLYGLSMDMLYNSTVLDVVNAAGEPLSAPVAPVISPSTFLQNGLIHNAVVDKVGNLDQLSFVKLLKGDVPGITLEPKTLFATIYFKVKEGQSFTGFGSLSLTDDLTQLAINKLCIKLSDSDGVKIPYEKAAYVADLNFTLTTVDFVGKNIVLSNMPAEVVILKNGSLYRSISVQAIAGINSYTFLATSKADLVIGDTCYIKIAGFKSEVFTFTQALAPDSTQNIALDLYSGDMNGDNHIDTVDAQLFAAAYGQTGNDLLADFNHDLVVNVKDVYFISKNLE